MSLFMRDSRSGNRKQPDGSWSRMDQIANKDLRSAQSSHASTRPS